MHAFIQVGARARDTGVHFDQPAPIADPLGQPLQHGEELAARGIRHQGIAQRSEGTGRIIQFLLADRGDLQRCRELFDRFRGAGARPFVYANQVLVQAVFVGDRIDGPQGILIGPVFVRAPVPFECARHVLQVFFENGGDLHRQAVTFVRLLRLGQQPFIETNHIAPIPGGGVQGAKGLHRVQVVAVDFQRALEGGDGLAGVAQPIPPQDAQLQRAAGPILGFLAQEELALGNLHHARPVAVPFVKIA